VTGEVLARVEQINGLLHARIVEAWFAHAVTMRKPAVGGSETRVAV
jgi:hypothetical protein